MQDFTDDYINNFIESFLNRLGKGSFNNVDIEKILMDLSIQANIANNILKLLTAPIFSSSYRQSFTEIYNSS